MEISRLPPVSGGRPAGTAHNRAAAPEPVDGPAAPASPSAARGGPERVRVVQGELLQRDHGFYQSTRAFIDERTFDQGLANHDRQGLAGRSRTAISHYLSNTPTTDDSAAVLRRPVNYYV